MNTRIVIADDHVILLQGIKRLLESEPGYEIVGEANDGREAVQLVRRLMPDIAVLDISMPGLNGLDAARRISRAAPATKTILLTVHRENPYVLEAMDAGVQGYVLKTQTASDLRLAVKEVSSGRVYLSPGISKIVIDAFRHREAPETDPLTLREREVLQLIAEGKTTKQVAKRLGISVKTAESHRTRLMSKLAIHNTAGLVHYAIRRGLINI